MTTLTEAGKAAGLRDDDLLKIAKTNLAPAEAIADLQRRFPDAFEPTFDARTASREDYAREKARVTGRWHTEPR